MKWVTRERPKIDRIACPQTYLDDREMLKHGMVMYDALYAWCSSCLAETRKWPPKMS